MRKIAIIDLGTNTFHLMIAHVHGSQVEVVHKEKVAVKIGEGGINDQVIIEAAQERAIAALVHFKEILTAQEVSEVYANATSAIRNANNSQEITKKIEDTTGIKIKVISGKEEAELIYYGVREAMNLGQEANLIMDIGGGSVEFVIANQNQIFYAESFEIGAQRLLDLFHGQEPMQGQDVDRLEKYISSVLQPLTAAVAQFNPQTLVGSSGSFDTLSDIYCNKDNIARNPTDSEFPLTVKSYLSIHSELLSKTKEERLQIPGMIPLRVDMIVVASCLIDWIIKNYNLEHIRVSAYALKEGALSRVLSQG
jgi:exopolyphosphatase/guanosine-5'-triphosphate,3'-diphosphate pyrophosphatase